MKKNILWQLGMLWWLGGSVAWSQNRPTPGANSDLPPPTDQDMSGANETVPFPDAGPPPSARPAARARPSSNSGTQQQSQKASPDTSQGVAQAAANLKLGDYVDLDDSIRNEMWGTINFPNVELKEIVTSFSKLTGKNFILDKKLEGKRISIVSQKPVTNREAYNAFLSALYANELTVVSLGSFLKIIETKNALQSNIRVFVGDYAPASEEIITLLYPLNFLNAEEIQRFLIDLVPRNGRITAYPNTNTLVMTDTGLNLRRIIAILKSIDVSGHEDRLESIPIRYASAKGIAQMIDDILDNQGGSGPRRSGANRGPQKTRGGGIISKIVPDERTNSLVVLANGRGIKELRDLVSKLDAPGASGSGNIHIYYCKNAVAEELAATINSLLTGQKQTAPGANPNPVPGNTFTGGSNVFQRRTGATQGDGVALEGNVRVTADKATNSLVVVGSSSDYASLRNVLQKLDIPRRQVFVEGTIMEISTSESDQFGFGVNVAAPGVAQVAGFNTTTPKVDFLSAISTPASLTGMVAGFKGGNAYTFDIPGVGTRTISTVTGLIQAIQTAKQGQILHQPQLLTSDNTDSEIKVTDKIPVQASIQKSEGTSNLTTTSFQKEDVAISLKITPQIGEDSDLIKLKVEQAIDDFQKSEFAGQIEKTERKANTTVSVRNGDTVVIGGLQKTTSSDARSKLPLLGDLPVLGWLFKGKESVQKKSNLILFLTPHVIKEYNDILKISARKLDERKEFGKKLYDPKDVQKADVDKLQKKNAEDQLKPAPKSWGGAKDFSEKQDFLTPEVDESGNWRSAEGQAQPIPLPDPAEGASPQNTEGVPVDIAPPSSAPGVPENTTVIPSPPSG